MECTSLVDPHQLLCPCFTVVFVLFCIYTTDNQFPRPIVKQGGGLFWILSDSNVSLEKQIWFTECIYLANYFKLRKKRKKSVPKTDCQTRRRILSHSNVTFDGQSSFSRGLSNMFSLWQRIDICSRVVFIPTMWLKKTFHSVFSFFSKFEIVRQINAFGKPDLFF
jgi:hypothetical protein